MSVVVAPAETRGHRLSWSWPMEGSHADVDGNDEVLRSEEDRRVFGGHRMENGEGLVGGYRADRKRFFTAVKGKCCGIVTEQTTKVCCRFKVV